jgi:hypothetical protein
LAFAECLTNYFGPLFLGFELPICRLFAAAARGGRKAAGWTGLDQWEEEIRNQEPFFSRKISQFFITLPKRQK